MIEENKESTDNKPSSKKDTYLILGAFALMIVAVFTIWQFLLKGKMDEEISKQKDTVMLVKTDTLRIKDSIKNNPSDKNQSKLNNTQQLKDSSSSFGQNDRLTDVEKSRLKDKFQELPESKKDKIKKKLRTGLNK